ncbi:hypothetical protein ACWEO2_02425 [Nocardia sp. NPDC004278]
MAKPSLPHSKRPPIPADGSARDGSRTAAPDRWSSPTARLGPGKYLADRDTTGSARLSYDQARDLLAAATATNGTGTGWDLHELRHSGLTHLGESGASLLELMAKSRHRKPKNLRRYFEPSPQAMRDLTSLRGPRAER